MNDASPRRVAKTWAWLAWHRHIRGEVAVRIDPHYNDGPIDPVTALWYEMDCPPILACPVRRQP